MVRPGGATCFRHDEPTSRFEGVAFSPDGRWLAAAGQVNSRLPNGDPPARPEHDTEGNGLVLVFDLETGKVLWRGPGRAPDSSGTSPSAPMARSLPPRTTPARSRSGIVARGAFGASSAGTIGWSLISRSARTGGNSHRRAGIRRSWSGTSPTAGR